MQRATYDLQQRRLAGPVATDDADRLALSHLEGDIPKRPELPLIIRRRSPCQPLQTRNDGLLQSVLRPIIQRVALAEPIDVNSSSVRGHRRSPYVSFGTTGSPPPR